MATAARMQLLQHLQDIQRWAALDAQLSLSALDSQLLNPYYEGLLTLMLRSDPDRLDLQYTADHLHQVRSVPGTGQEWRYSELTRIYAQEVSTALQRPGTYNLQHLDYLSRCLIRALTQDAIADGDFTTVAAAIAPLWTWSMAQAHRLHGVNPAPLTEDEVTLRQTIKRREAALAENWTYQLNEQHWSDGVMTYQVMLAHQTVAAAVDESVDVMGIGSSEEAMQILPVLINGFVAGQGYQWAVGMIENIPAEAHNPHLRLISWTQSAP